MDTTHHPHIHFVKLPGTVYACSSCTFFFFFLDSQTAGTVTSCSEGVADVTGEVVKLRLGKTPGIESKRLF